MGAARSEAPPSATLLAGKDPFRKTADDYYQAGWLPMYLPARRKEEPPGGYTGWTPRNKVNASIIATWKSKAPRGANICARPRADYIGIDVDLYADKEGTWDKILEDIGEHLPDTWISSARTDGSGIRHYRLPEGYSQMEWPGDIAHTVQFVHWGHRYAVLPPSRHPEDVDGRPNYYKWYEPGDLPDGESESLEFPAFDELPELPVEVIEYFTKGQYAKILPVKTFKGGLREAIKESKKWAAAHDGEPCARMLRVIDDIEEEFSANGAHVTMNGRAYQLTALAAEGHSGFLAARDRLQEAFLAEVRRERPAGRSRGAAESEEEWLRSVEKAIQKIMFREAANEFVGHHCTCGELDAEGKPKPQFNVVNYDLVDALEKCYGALSATELTGWNGAYNRGGQIMLRTRHGLAEADVNSLRSAVARATEWLKPGGDGPPQKAVAPRDFLSTLLVDAELNTLPGLRYITRSPFWSLVNGKPELVHENGYHAGPQVILDMDPELAEAVRNVDGSKLEYGLKKIDYMLHKLPFKDKAADRANVYAALLLPYVRELIVGPTPLHLIHAPSPGSGKTLLANSISQVVCGMAMTDRFSVTLPNGKNADEEIRKLTTTGLKQSPRVFIWDNIVGEVRSKEIAQALTEPIYNARHLGTDDGLLLPNACLWLGTGNQFKAIEDIRRRIVPIELRAFTSRKAPFDMDAFLEKDRKYIVWALLTMVQVWVEEGAPLARNVTLPSYERYTEIIGGILEVNGIEGFLGNLAEFNEQTTGDTGEYPELIEEWASKHSTLEMGEWYRVGDIMNGLNSVAEWVDKSKPGATRALGAILSSMRDRPIGENREYLLQFKRPGNVAHYMLSPRNKAKVVKRGGARGRVR